MVSKIFVLIFWVIENEVTKEKTHTCKENPGASATVCGEVSHPGDGEVVEEADEKTADNMELQVHEGKEVNDEDYHVSLLNLPAGITDMVGLI